MLKHFIDWRMRIRKKQWVESFLQQDHPTFIKEPKKLKGKWKTHSKKPMLHVEIGAGKGDYWIFMAQKYPDRCWVAVEKETTVAAVAIRKSLQFKLDQAYMIIGDAIDAEHWFADQEIDVLHLNFSDPWPKKGHSKRRLSSKQFIDIYTKLLADDGKIIMKTDNGTLFEYSLVMFNKEGFRLEEVWVDFRKQDHPEDVISEYEQRFIDLDQPIYRAIWRKHD